MHDKRIADEEALAFGRGGSPCGGSPCGGELGQTLEGQTLELLQDVGFQGYAPEGVVVVQPTKKPRGQELSEEQKQANRAISKQRVVVEHAIGGVKTWRVVKEQFRSWCHALRDRVMYLACGLHNFRLACRAGPLRT